MVDVAAAVAGHENEGLAGGPGFGASDQLDAGAVGKLLIDQVDVVLIGLDADRCLTDAVADDVDVSLERGIGERHVDQRSRLRVVVHEQDAHDFEVGQRGGWTTRSRTRVSPPFGRLMRNVLPRLRDPLELISRNPVLGSL